MPLSLKKMNKLIRLSLLSFALVFTITVQAQDPYFFKWYDAYHADSTVNSGIKNNDTSLAGIPIIDRMCVDYKVEFYKGAERLIEYNTYHVKRHINSKKAIENNNKIYINLNNAIDLYRSELRVIKADGSVIETDKGDIKEAENFEEYGRYKYIAVHGMEIGVDMEYIYTVKKFPNLNGRRIRFQTTKEIEHVEFVLQAPDYLGFEFKSLNGFPEVIQDTTDTTIALHRVTVANLPALKDERYGAYDIQRQGIIYKLSENYSTGKKQLVTYAEVARNVYDNMHSGFDKGDIKALKAASKQLKLKKLSQVEKIRAIEEYLKNAVNIVNSSDPAHSDVSEILQNKIVSNTGIVKMYTLWLEHLNIPYELGLYSERFEEIFEPEFESYHCLGSYFVYFPSLDKYIYPRVWNYRLGPPLTSFAFSHALYLSPETFGDWTTYLAEVRWVKPMDKDFTYTNHDIDINFGAQFEKNELMVTTEYAGYDAVSMQGSFESLNEEVKADVQKALVEYISDGEKEIEATIENANYASVFQKPLIVKSKLNYSNLVSKAGTKHLVNLGKVIGPQSELYNEGERTTDIFLYYNHTYKRNITFTIPSGFTAKNLDDLKINASLELNDDTVAYFNSDYTINGDKIHVTVTEYYDELFLPKKHYNAFSEVINAAADFNKVVLVFEPS